MYRKKWLVSVILVLVIGLGLVYFSVDQTLKPLEDRVKKKYTEIKDVYTVQVGPHCNIIYHVDNLTTVEDCEKIFYETIRIIDEEGLYKKLDDYQEKYVGGGIVFFAIEFTSKEEDKPRYGLICEFELDPSSTTPGVYDPKQAVWIGLDENDNILGEYRHQ